MDGLLFLRALLENGLLDLLGFVLYDRMSGLWRLLLLHSPIGFGDVQPLFELAISLLMEHGDVRRHVSLVLVVLDLARLHHLLLNELRVGLRCTAVDAVGEFGSIEVDGFGGFEVLWI